MLCYLRYMHSDVFLTKIVTVVSVIDKTTFLLTSRAVFSLVLSVTVLIILSVVIFGGTNAVREETGHRYAQKQLNTSDRHAVQCRGELSFQIRAKQIKLLLAVNFNHCKTVKVVRLSTALPTITILFIPLHWFSKKVITTVSDRLIIYLNCLPTSLHEFRNTPLQVI